MGQPLDPLSDLYSLGCVLYQTLSGDTPIKSDNILNVLFNHMNVKPATLDSVSLNIPPELERIIYKCLCKQPSKRYETMAQLKSDLTQVQSLINNIADSDLDKTINTTVKALNEPEKSNEPEKLSEAEKSIKPRKKKPPSDRFIKLLTKAKAGESGAQFDVAWAYELGDEIDKDLHMSFYWFKTAAENGHSQAMHKTGYMLENGMGTTVNHERAFQWYKKSADAGEVFGERDLGYCYRWGIGVEADLDMAYFWTSIAAQKGDPTAQCTLGDFFLHGVMQEVDIAKAIEWYTLAAEQNDSFSQHALGLIYLFQENHRDEVRGLMWLEQAAEQQHKDAVIELANHFYMRRREGKNLSKAIYWLQLASVLGDEQALARYEQCKKESENSN